LLVNGTSGNFFEHLHTRGHRFQAVGNVIVASRHWHGTHQLEVGGNVAGLLFSQSAERTVIQALSASGTLVRQSTFAGPATPEVSNTQAGGYAQDNWSFSKRLVLQAGLRTDWDRFTQSAMVEPWLSGNILPFGDDRSKISLGWGIYNAPLNLSLIAQASDQRSGQAKFMAWPSIRKSSLLQKSRNTMAHGQTETAPDRTLTVRLPTTLLTKAPGV
jgi:TonB dependent receptor